MQECKPLPSTRTVVWRLQSAAASMVMRPMM